MKLLIYIIFSIGAYTFIAYKVYQSRNEFAQNISVAGVDQQRVRNERTTFGKEFKVPLVIISTFLLFYVIPHTFIRFSDGRKSEIERRSEVPGYYLCYLSQVVGTIVDALTYIFLVKHYRKNIAGKLKPSCLRTSSTESSDEHYTSS